MVDGADDSPRGPAEGQPTERLAKHPTGRSTTPTPADSAAPTLPMEGDRVRIVFRREDSPEQERTFDGPDEFLIGRSGKARWRLDDPRVSGRHALLIATIGRCEIRDLKSTHGTRVNGERVESRELNSGDLLEIGGARFRVEIARGEPAAPTACSSSDPSIPGYELVRMLGQGAQGRVHLAKDLSHAGRLVALKTMLIPWHLPADDRQRTTRWFVREAQNARGLRHPHIVECYADGRAGDHLYIAMEYLPGGDLWARVDRDGPLQWDVAARYMLDAVTGMAEAHARGLVHRDIKPQNLLLSGEDRVKVGDLGLAKNFSRAGLSGSTPSGAVGGTWMFMAPEQVTEYRYVGPTADVYSLGATFFYLLTKQGVYEPQDPASTWEETIAEVPIRDVCSLAPSVPKEVAQVVERAIKRDATARFEDAGAMRDALTVALAAARA